MNKGLNDLYDAYIAWRKLNEELIIDGHKVSNDCGEEYVRQDFSHYAGLKEVVSFEDMFEMEKQYTVDEY